MREVCHLNGHIVPLSLATIPVEDRSCQFGDGVYEVVRFVGRRGVRLDAHLRRLAESAAHLHITGAPAPGEWLDIIARLQDEAGIPDDNAVETILYQHVSRGVAPRAHLWKPGITAHSLAYFRPCPRCAPGQRENGVMLISQPDERWNRCFIKSVALLPAVMAKHAAFEQGGFEALLVRDGMVTEGGSTNLFCVRGGTLFTHPRGPRILSGITRQVVLEAAAREGVPAREEPVAHADFAAADEAFICSTTMNVLPATRLDHAPIGDGQVGPVTRQLARAVEEILSDEITRDKAV